MEIWKTLRVSHIPTPPATTTDKCQKRRYTNNPLGTKDRSGQIGVQFCSLRRGLNDLEFRPFFRRTCAGTIHVITKVRCRAKLQASNLPVILHTKPPRDDEGERLFALYEASSAKEIAATCQLLYPRRILPHETYMQLVGDLRAIRTKCNDNRLAIAAHHRKT